MSKHTPGLWKVEETKAIGFRIQAGSKIICWERQEEYEGLPEGQANAALIAAAPELLEACKYAAELVKVARQYFPKSIKNSDKFQLENVCATIGKAIHKAEAIP